MEHDELGWTLDLVQELEPYGITLRPQSRRRPDCDEFPRAELRALLDVLASG